MSCFVMNPEPLAALANTIAMVLYGGYNACGFEAPKSLYDTLRDCHEGYDRRAIPGCEKKIRNTETTVSLFRTGITIWQNFLTAGYIRWQKTLP